MTAKKQSNAQKENRSITVAEKELRDEIIEEAKKIACNKTSSAGTLVSKTKELLKIESMKLEA